MQNQDTDAQDTDPTFISFLISFFLPPPASSSLAFEIRFQSNTNFKRRLSISGSQINFTPTATWRQVHTHTHQHAVQACMHRDQQTSHTTDKAWHCSALIKHTKEVTKRSRGMIAIISLVKYQDTLISKICVFFPCSYQYYNTERL